MIKLAIDVTDLAARLRAEGLEEAAAQLEALPAAPAPAATAAPRVVYVVMSNDFPDGVFTTEALADAYCAAAKAKDQAVRAHGPGIYYRAHAFPLRDTLK